MQQALPYTNWLPTAAVNTTSTAADADHVKQLVAENAVVVLARRGCCMCHVVKLLLHGHGVNPSIFDVDDENEDFLIKEFSTVNAAGKSAPPQFPAVFVGGKLFGGLEQVMAAHISGELVPRLREARALWL